MVFEKYNKKKILIYIFYLNNKLIEELESLVIIYLLSESKGTPIKN